MTQKIIVYLIGAVIVVYIAIKVVVMFTKPGSSCSGCGHRRDGTPDDCEKCGKKQA